MKTPKPLGLTLASLMLLTSATGVLTAVEPARADNDDWFEEVRENCRRVNNGYFCRESDRYERSSRDRYGHGSWKKQSKKRRQDDYYSNRRNDDYYYNSRNESRPGRLYEGSVIQTRTFDNDRIQIRRGDSRSLTLVVDRDVRSDTDNYVLIPKGSRIYGKLKPDDGGIRFKADDIVLPNGRRYDLDARSETIYARNRSGSRISNSAATVILGSILGRDRDSRVGDVIRGGEIFTRSRNRRDGYIYINPKKDLDLRLTDDFRIR